MGLERWGKLSYGPKVEKVQVATAQDKRRIGEDKIDPRLEVQEGGMKWKANGDDGGKDGMGWIECGMMRWTT